MGGLFSSETTQTAAPQQVKNDPWIGAQPGLNTLFGAGVNQFNAGPQQYYPGSTVAGQSWDTQHALHMGETVGNEALGTQWGAKALDSGQQQNLDTSNGRYLGLDPSTSGYSQFANGGFMGQTAGDSQLGAIGNGAMLYGNPYVDSMFNQAAGQVGQQFKNNVMPSIASMFAGGGRYGSEGMANGIGQAQQNYGNQVNNLATSIYGGNYANERNLLQQALTQMNNTGLAERGQQLSGLSQLSSQFQNERNRQMQATSMAPSLAQADWNDVNNLGKIGTMRDAYSQSLINADKARFDFGQQAPWQNLSNLSSIMGIASPYGQKNTTGGGGTTSEGPSTFNEALGLLSLFAL
jgi:hypothetical protein